MFYSNTKKFVNRLSQYLEAEEETAVTNVCKRRKGKSFTHENKPRLFS
jgi:hypothetical protein